ncbi:4'-phosphopantetheinyl transferase family protein [Brevibacillus halotolerans]|uniref:4'-phosphopantetheinyl transferase family protein n=1 Tax=Brevibacillus halotolerans TaxID=1507437 RepID=UPI0015EF15AC|nr:4'-phosphopantetheinyl transferase superfamily protein [Brevibacillus halotolerans]MBA4534784.1 4'-phosphopantetheinyl transferase superfamily protein [Brevibacillus halotolerans]
MTNVFALHIPAELEKDTFTRLLDHVSQEKREKILRFHRREDAYRGLLADLLVRYILLTHHFISKEEIQFEYNEYGKPYLPYTNCNVNLSHSGEWVVCGTGIEPVGIDVEQQKPIEMEIAKHYFSKQEYTDLVVKSEGEEQLSYFYDLWTLKESYIKAVGKGLSIPLSSFSIRKNENGTIDFSEEIPSQTNWFFKQYQLAKGYPLSVCSASNQFAEEVKMIRVDELIQYFDS